MRNKKGEWKAEGGNEQTEEKNGLAHIDTAEDTVKPQNLESSGANKSDFTLESREKCLLAPAVLSFSFSQWLGRTRYCQRRRKKNCRAVMLAWDPHHNPPPPHLPSSLASVMQPGTVQSPAKNGALRRLTQCGVLKFPAVKA